jgi:Uma2 family endonuclease
MVIFQIEAYERGNKFFMYRRNPHLQDYVLVSSKEIAIDLTINLLLIAK